MDPENLSRPGTPRSLRRGRIYTREVDGSTGSYDLSSDSEVRERRSRSPTYRRQTHNYVLYEDRKGDPTGTTQQAEEKTEEPAVIWTATVFDANDETPKSQSRPTAIYHDDRPMELRTSGPHPNALPSRFPATSGDVPETQTPFPRWKGYIFTVKVQALANFPTRRHSNRVEDRSGFAPLGRRGASQIHVPSKPDSLQLEALSRTSVLISSPFLCTKLVDIVGYYPSFCKIINRELLDLSHTSCATTYSRLRVFEPYAAFMHNFPQIAALAESKGSDKIAGQSGVQSEKPCKNPEDEILRLQIRHVRQLYGFLKPLHDAVVLPIQEQLKKDTPRLTFDMLWYIFRPGTDVYVDIAGSIQTCVVMDVLSNYDNDDAKYSEAQINETRLRYYVLDLWHLDTDGNKIGRVLTTRRIEGFTGFKDVVELEACPVPIWDNFDKGKDIFWHAMMGQLTVGGRQYVGSVVIDFRKGLTHTKTLAPNLGRVRDNVEDFVEYDNILVKESRDSGAEVVKEIVIGGSDPSASEDESSSKKSTKLLFGEGNTKTKIQTYPSASARAVAGSVSRAEPGVSVGGSGHTPYFNQRNFASRSKPKAGNPAQKDLTDHQLLLLSPMTYAFTLKTKQWFDVDVEYVHEIAPSDLSMKNLVLGESELETIRGLSSRQNSKRDVWAADFIEGKGTGQIILLHGPPGVGKTYTVEAIAEWLHRPLLALTVADIGTVETRVERELIKWFSLAEAWNAVLLVDEADIFLERRQNRDLARNGLVSAFLRRMEYFKGLLFLTTNRVGQIDDAFISRVHIAIGYKTLTGPDRKKIWDGFLQKLVKERAGKIQVALSAKKWVLENAVSGKSLLNGRDIRNALQSAITLAEAESAEDPEFDPDKMAVVVDQSHFQRVLDISVKFHEYVKSIRREDEKKRAAGRLDRNDYYWQGESG